MEAVERKTDSMEAGIRVMDANLASDMRIIEGEFKTLQDCCDDIFRRLTTIEDARVRPPPRPPRPTLSVTKPMEISRSNPPRQLTRSALIHTTEHPFTARPPPGPPPRPPAKPAVAKPLYTWKITQYAPRNEAAALRRDGEWKQWYREHGVKWNGENPRNWNIIQEMIRSGHLYYNLGGWTIPTSLSPKTPREWWNIPHLLEWLRENCDYLFEWFGSQK
jgi:hypothetical protein